jgi:hypothetical protein
MKSFYLALGACGLLLLQGCASTAQMEQRQLAWDGHGSNPCLFGGVTDQAQAHCQSVRLGGEGTLMAINTKAMQGLSKSNADHPCQVHVARVEAALANNPNYRTQRIYSCPEGGSENCHVSLLVAANREMYVLDNGAVLKSNRYAASVAHLDEFSEELNDVYWIGRMPDNAHAIAAAAR